MGDGGGITLGGAANVNTVVAVIDASTIFNNTADGNGGGIAQDADSSLNVTSSTIIGNGPNSEATIDGGGLYLSGDGTSVDSFFNDTIGEAATAGAKIVAVNANSANEGGGVYISGVDPTFTDDLISGRLMRHGRQRRCVYIGGGEHLHRRLRSTPTLPPSRAAASTSSPAPTRSRTATSLGNEVTGDNGLRRWCLCV